MNLWRLILRNLAYFRGVNAAVIAGVAVATAVLSGALMVGDSVRASLTDLAVRRLGKIDHAIVANRFFDAKLVERVGTDPSIAGRFELTPAILVQGGAALDSGMARTAGVQIIAGGDWAPVSAGSCVINSQVAESLGMTSPGGEITVSLPMESDMPTDAPLARRARQDTLSGMRLRISQIVSEPGMLSLFTPQGGQRMPQNIWVNLAELQDAVGQHGQVNQVWAHEISESSDGAQQLNSAVHRGITLADYGLMQNPAAGGSETSLTSRTTYIAPPIATAASKIARENGTSIRTISINLLNDVKRVQSDGSTAASIHYAVAAGISALNDSSLADDDAALNEWTANQLGAKVGDRIGFSFYQRQADGALVEVTDVDRGFANHFRVARILPMSGIGADPQLTPVYKGLTDSDSIANWNPPEEVKIDKKLVAKEDEAYWKQYKAAPKLFLSFASAQRLWGNALGDVTSIRIPTPQAEGFINKLLAEVDPAAMGLSFRPLRAQQLAAASGTTDFGQLFIGFSFFLIAAAALLVAMLLRLGVEQRSRQLGAMTAIGFSPKLLRRTMLGEGTVLSVIGGIIGSVAAVGYTWLMMAALRSWWVGAVGTTAMRLEVVPLTLVIGFISTQVVALIAVFWAVRNVGRMAPARLLAGGWEASVNRQDNRATFYQWIGLAGSFVGIVLIGVSLMGKISQQVAFLAGGSILLMSGLCLLRGVLHVRRDARSVRTVARLAILNSTRHATRSVFAAGLIALAAFALVTVAAMRQGEPSDTADVHSGAGGYRLIVESPIPLLGNPGTEQGRSLLGFREPNNPLWNRVEFLPMRRHAGQDISCLNLTQANSPTMLAVPKSMIARGGFSHDTENPFTALQTSDTSGAVPVITDDSTAQYILHLSIGETIEVPDASGKPRPLKLAGTLPHSIFQSQLLMSEDRFMEMFPNERWDPLESTCRHASLSIL